MGQLEPFHFTYTVSVALWVSAKPNIVFSTECTTMESVKDNIPGSMSYGFGGKGGQKDNFLAEK